MKSDHKADGKGFLKTVRFGSKQLAFRASISELASLNGWERGQVFVKVIRDDPSHIFTLPYRGRVWSSIIIVHEKSVFFLPSFFRNISKTAETILIKKKKLAETMHDISVYKKSLISEHRKNFFFQDNNCFVKISVSLCVTNFCGRTSSKTRVNIKTKFPT